MKGERTDSHGWFPTIREDPTLTPQIDYAEHTLHSNMIDLAGSTN